MSQPPFPPAATLERKRSRCGDARLDEVVSIAAEIFRDRGYSLATMKEIADRAGASKETLYRHFGNKEGLYAAVVRSCLPDIWGGSNAELPADGDPYAVLFDVGFNHLRGLNHPNSVAFFRMIVSEVPRVREIGRILYEQGVLVTHRRLAYYFHAATELGRLRCDDPDHLAMLFLASVLGDQRLVHLLGIDEKTWSEPQMRDHVDKVVRLVLGHHAVLSGA